MDRGIRILEEVEGTGAAAEYGDTVAFDVQVSLNRGEVIEPRISTEHRIGRRMIMAGIEKSLEGMRAGGYRKVRVSPYLGYRDGIQGRFPPNAVLICEIWVHRIQKPIA